MPRRKVSMSLIPNSRLRANTFAKRKEGLKKKASELATLCGVRVALVCGTDGAGAGVADVWESEAGVLDAYRDLPPEERARHTHGAYAELELRKAEAKLAKVRQEGPAALAPRDAAVYALTLDEAHQLLAAVDEALRAANERRGVLGLQVEDDGGDSWLMGFAAPGVADAILPLGLAAPPFPLSNLDGYLQRGQCNDVNEQIMWGNGFDPHSNATNWQPAGFGFQQCTGDMHGYKLQPQTAADMYGNNSSSSSSIGRLLNWDAFHPAPTNAVVAMQQAGYGLECTGNGYVGTTSSYLTTQQVPSNGIVPHGYAYHPSSLEAGPATSINMGTVDNFFNEPQAQPLAVSYTGDPVIYGSEYTAQWPAAGQLHQNAGSNKSLW